MISMSNLPARFLLFSSALAVCSVAAGAPLPFAGTPQIEQTLHKLNELGSVLMIGAHPDDERTPVLAYFARGRYMRTGISRPRAAKAVRT